MPENIDRNDIIDMKSIIRSLQKRGPDALSILGDPSGRYDVSWFFQKIKNTFNDRFPVFRIEDKDARELEQHFLDVITDEVCSREAPVNDADGSKQVLHHAHMAMLSAPIPAARFAYETYDKETGMTHTIVFEALDFLPANARGSKTSSAPQEKPSLNTYDSFRVYFLVAGSEGNVERISLTPHSFYILLNRDRYKFSGPWEYIFAPLEDADIPTPSPAEISTFNRIIEPVFKLLWVLGRNPKLIEPDGTKPSIGSGLLKAHDGSRLSDVRSWAVDQNEMRRIQRARVAREVASRVAARGGYNAGNRLLFINRRDGPDRYGYAKFLVGDASTRDAEEEADRRTLSDLMKPRHEMRDWAAITEIARRYDPTLDSVQTMPDGDKLSTLHNIRLFTSAQL